MNLELVKDHGKKFDSLDVAVAMQISGSFSIYPTDGYPVCGRHVPGIPTVKYTDSRYKLKQ